MRRALRCLLVGLAALVVLAVFGLNVLVELAERTNGGIVSFE